MQASFEVLIVCWHLAWQVLRWLIERERKFLAVDLKLLVASTCLDLLFVIFLQLLPGRYLPRHLRIFLLSWWNQLSITWHCDYSISRCCKGCRCQIVSFGAGILTAGPGVKMVDDLLELGFDNWLFVDLDRFCCLEGAEAPLIDWCDFTGAWD